MKKLGMAASLALVLLAAACGSSGSGGSAGSATSNGVVNLVLWMGYTPPPPASQGAEYESLKGLVADFTKLHPKIHIKMEYVDNDYALQKVTVALQGGEQPDISYQYGTNMPQIAQAPEVVNLTKIIKQPAFGWNDFTPGERDVATVNGKVLGVPALVDNLAVVYNKTLFAQHHLAPPGPDWTWSQLAADAKAISDPAKKIFGLTFPADGSETTVWEYEAMLWEAGGYLLNPAGTQAAFNSPAGVQALQTLRSMQQAHSLYLDFHPDAGQSESLFNSGKLGMIITGPWDLANEPKSDGITDGEDTKSLRRFGSVNLTSPQAVTIDCDWHANEVRVAVRNILYKMWSGALNPPKLMAVPKLKVLRFNDANSDFQQKERDKYATEGDSEFRHETSHASFLGFQRSESQYVRIDGLSKQSNR